MQFGPRDFSDEHKMDDAAFMEQQFYEFKEGDKVKGQYNGKWFGATFKKFNGDGTAEIHWDDKTKSVKQKLSAIRYKSTIPTIHVVPVVDP